jgi:hypothetical protein
MKLAFDRARNSGKPPLIWGLPGAQNEEEARRILDLVMDILDKQHLSRNWHAPLLQIPFP